MFGSNKYPPQEDPEKDLMSFCEDQAIMTDTVTEYKQRKLGRHRQSMLCFNISVLFQLVILIVASGFCLWLYSQYKDIRAELEELKSEALNLRHTGRAEAQYATNLHNHTSSQDYHPTLEDMMNAHHGIANSEIAHIYGDDSILQSYIRTVPPGGYDKLVFNRQGHFPECRNCTVYMNANNDIWYLELKRFAVGLSSGQENYYRYFKQADWMRNRQSNYIVTDNSKIKVKTDGMYQIYGHMQFVMEQGISTEGSMRIMKLRRGRTTVLGACYVSAARLEGHRWQQQHHCSVYQVSMLKKRDEIYIDIEAFSVFTVHPDQLHLTVIKLNSGDANHTHDLTH